MENEEDDKMTAMEKAIKAVREGMSYRQASIEYDVGKTTLVNRILGLHSKANGRPPNFTSSEDEIIKNVIRHCRRMGLQIHRQKNLQVVEKMAASKGVDASKFKARWTRSFLRRHPLEAIEKSSLDVQDAEAVAEATVQMVDASISITEMNLSLSTPSTSFAQLQSALSEAELVHEMHKAGYLDAPQSIWVVVESFISLRDYYKKYYGATKTPGSEKILRVLVCGNAAGCILPPSVILPKEEEELDDRDYSDFVAMAREKLFPSMTVLKNVIILDRASSRLRRESDFILACSESGKDIKLLQFPPGKLPMNWSVRAASLLQKRWKFYLKTAYVHSDMQPTEGNLFDVADHMTKAWDKPPLKQIFLTAFEKSGLHPYQPEVFVSSANAKILITGPEVKHKIPHKKDRAKVRELLSKMGLTKEQYVPIMKTIRDHIDANLPEERKRIIRKPRPRRSAAEIAADEAMIFAEEEI